MRSARPHHLTRRRRAAWAIAAGALVACGCSDQTDEPATTADDDRREVIDQRAPSGANGLKVAGDGTLWIAVVNDDEILQVDPDSGEILRRVSTPEGSGPDDVALLDDGTLYWTGYVSGEVGRILPDSDESEVIADVGAGANPIAVRSDGAVIVGRAGAATGLWEIDPTGDAAPVELADPGNLNSFDITDDDVLYGPSLGEAAVVRVDPFTGETSAVVADVDGAPVALRWHDNRIHVLVLGASTTVDVVDPDSGEVTSSVDTGLTVADNLAVADDGRVFVTGLTEPTVTVLGPDGTVERTLRIGA